MIRENIIDRKLSALGDLVMVLVKAWPLWIMGLCAVVPIADPWLRTEEVIMKIGVFYQTCYPEPGWPVVA
jgi:hypothetical protein